MFNLKIKLKAEVYSFGGSYKIFSNPEDLLHFIADEEPHIGITEDEKIKINKIGTSLNNVIRSDGNLNNSVQQQKDLLQRLINKRTLRENIVVHRAVNSIEYELKLAKDKGLPKGYLYHNAFVYTSLLKAYQRKVHLNIFIPSGTPYLYTGLFSNTCGVYPPLEDSQNVDNVGELILDIGTVFKIDKRRRKDKVTIYDVHVENNIW